MSIRPLLALRPLSDGALIGQLKSLVQREREITLDVLLRLIEVERRGLHLRRYSSLFVYCTDRLGYSPSAAGRRIRAARCLRDFPRVYSMLLEGRLNLSTVCIVARVLTAENEAQLLQRVAGKPQDEVERVVAAMSAPVKPRESIRPILLRTGIDGRAGRAGVGADSNGADRAGVGADSSGGNRAGVGQDSSDGDRAGVGRDSSDGNRACVGAGARADGVGRPGPKAPNALDHAEDSGPTWPSPAGRIGRIDVPVDGSASSSGDDPADDAASSSVDDSTDGSASSSVGDSASSSVDDQADGFISSSLETSVNESAERSVDSKETPLFYRIQIIADASFMAKLERARALVSRGRLNASIADVLEKALDEFLKRQDPEQRIARRQQRAAKSPVAACSSGHISKAAPPRTEGASAPSVHTQPQAVPSVDDAIRTASVDTSRDTPDDTPKAAPDATPNAARDAVPHAAPDAAPQAAPDTSSQAPDGMSGVASYNAPHKQLAEWATAACRRSIPAALRDEVWCRDGGRCTHVGPEGRCPETHGLQIDHIDPVGLGGLTELANVRLLCVHHNQSEADRIFGNDFMDLRRRRTPAAGVNEPDRLRSSDQPIDVNGPVCSRPIEQLIDVDEPIARVVGTSEIVGDGVGLPTNRADRKDQIGAQ